MAKVTDPRQLPGFMKRSYNLPLDEHTIWFELIDGMHKYEDLVLEKLEADVRVFVRPSSSEYVCFICDGTTITDKIAKMIEDAILNRGKKYTKIAFCGINLFLKIRFKKAFKDKGFKFEFFDGIKDAKEWLI